MKIAASSFIVRALLKRLLGRTVSKEFLEFISVPIFGLWNYFITKKNMHESRVRSVGPYAAKEFFKMVYPNDKTLDISSEYIRLHFLVIQKKIIISEKFHPNTLIFLNLYLDRFSNLIDDVQESSLIQSLPNLDLHSQTEIVKIYFILIALEGKFLKKDKKFLRQLENLGVLIPYEYLNDYISIVSEGNLDCIKKHMERTNIRV